MTVPSRNQTIIIQPGICHGASPDDRKNSDVALLIPVMANNREQSAARRSNSAMTAPTPAAATMDSGDNTNDTDQALR